MLFKTFPNNFWGKVNILRFTLHLSVCQNNNGDFIVAAGDCDDGYVYVKNKKLPLGRFSESYACKHRMWVGMQLNQEKVGKYVLV